MTKFMKKKTLGIKRRAGGHMIQAAKSPIPSSACAVACPMTEENAKTVPLGNSIMTTPPNPLLVLTEEGQTSAFHHKSACSAWWAKFGPRLKSEYDLPEAMALGFELEDENAACTVELAGLLLGRVHKAVIAGLLRRRMQETGMNARDWIYIELLEDAVRYLMTPPERHRLASLPDEGLPASRDRSAANSQWPVVDDKQDSSAEFRRDFSEQVSGRNPAQDNSVQRGHHRVLRPF
ncbi:hypothetical protein [Paraburkholderia elongata]|uniref:Uncharacterized protein n=1 Tax=Paraburkholderia elongata TaxID=2675747 RepID=A0A972SNL3_9BURK|nr:hypothetical protein [Paraburkholderia elongata]NPT62338.1 hypothetical protein [Paraburkholderia elongata]